jgi:2-phospho-L-lactate/phosphoenolpyruvate guanylyltransferase
MMCWAIIPLKEPQACKTRLRGALSGAERRWLVARMARHVVDTARSCGAVDHVAILGPERHGMDSSIQLIEDRGPDLNAALSSAFEYLRAAGVDKVVVLPGDLPLLQTADVQALAQAADVGVGIAPDVANTGTNALSFTVLRPIRPAFGPNSFSRHCADAARAGLLLRIVRSPSLALDVDDVVSLKRSGLPERWRISA